ncbi:increased loss of mitochondrial DNA protein 1 [Geopyxis carbonaria]|nr:increased loss of mitochondrial DNA protein 1 [Geopyxis carbonaria]
MPLISAHTLIRIVASFHLTLGYLLIKSPETLSRVDSINVLGEALGLQQPNSALWQNPLAAGIAGLVLILSGISDMIATGGQEDTARNYWGNQGPVRCTFFAFVTGYIYIFKPGLGNTNYKTSEPLLNSLVFGWAFFESIWWFWIFTNLREEKSEAMARIARRRKHQEELEEN